MGDVGRMQRPVGERMGMVACGRMGGIQRRGGKPWAGSPPKSGTRSMGLSIISP